MARLIILILSVSVFIPHSFASLSARTNLGLFGGQIEALAAFNISSGSNRIYADVRGPNALYYSDNDGASWVESITAEETNGVVTDATYVYSIVSGKIWRSAGNDGRSWTEILPASSTVYTGEQFHSIQHDGSRLIIGCASGVAYFNTTGDPTAWTKHTIASVADSEAVFSVISQPGTPSILLAIVQNRMQPAVASNRLLQSTDTGTTWSAVSLPSSITQPIEVIGIDPTNVNRLYVGGSSAQATVYYNSNYLSSTTWSNITPSSFMSRYPQYIEFKNGLMWTTAHTYDVSTNSWTQLPSTTDGTNLNDGAIVFDPDDSSIVYTTSDVGVAKSITSGATFTESNQGILGVQVNDVDVDLTGSKNFAVVATKSGVAITSVFQKPPTPADWTYPVFPQGTGGAPLTSCALVWGTTNEIVVGENSENIYLSTNGGSTWTKTFTWAGSPIQDRSTINDIDSAAASNVLYAAIGYWEKGTDGVVVRSDDRGATWVTTSLAGVHCNALEVVGSNLVYTAAGHELDGSSTTNQGIYVSNDSGTTWTQLTFDGSVISGNVVDLAQDPVNPLIQYAAVRSATASSVYKIEYATGGTSVAALTDLSAAYGGPNNRLTAIETDNTGRYVFVGAEENVFSFDTTTNTWALYTAGVRGEEIFVLYWDALVSGNSTGFYAHADVAQATPEATQTPTPAPTETLIPTPEPTFTATPTIEFTATNTPRPDNAAPTITLNPATVPSVVGVNQPLIIQIFVSDSNGDEIALTLSPDAVATLSNVTQSGGNLTASLTINASVIGIHSFALTANDGSDPVTLNFTITVAEPTPIPTSTHTPTETAVPTETPIPTETPALAESPTPSETSTPTQTATVTNTEAPTSTPTATPTETVTPTPTAVGETPVESPIVEEILIAQGRGGRNRISVRNFDARAPQAVNGIITQFRVISDAFINSVGGGAERATYFSAGDLNGDTIPDVVLSFGAASGTVVHPNVVLPLNILTRSPIGHTFVAFPSGSGNSVRFSGGEVRTAVGDFFEDGKNLVAVAQGAGSQLGIVRLFEYTGQEPPRSWRVVAQFQPLDNRPQQNNANGGVTLTAGDVDNDGRDELLVGQTNSNTSLTQFSVIDVDPNANHTRRNFVGFPTGFRGQGGIELTVADLNGDGKQEIIASSKGKAESELGNLLSVIVPVIENQSVTGFTRPESSILQLIASDIVNPGGALNIGAGDFDGDNSNGQEIVIGSGDGAPQSFYRIVKVNFDPSVGDNGTVTGFSYLIGPPGNLDFVQPAFLNNDNPSSGEVFVDGVEFLKY